MPAFNEVLIDSLFHLFQGSTSRVAGMATVTVNGVNVSGHTVTRNDFSFYLAFVIGFDYNE